MNDPSRATSSPQGAGALRRPAVATVTLAAALALGLAACGRSVEKEAPKQLVVSMWSEYIDPEIPKAFEQETGIPVRIDVYEATEELMAKLEQGADNQYDLLVVSDHAIPVLARRGMLQPLDRSKIAGLDAVDQLFVKPVYDPEDLYSVPYQWGTVGLMVRRDAVGEGDPSWSWILDPASDRGPFVLIDSMRDMLGVALKAAGASVNARDPEAVRQAGEAVLAAKRSPRFGGFDGGVGGKNKVLAGTATMAIVYSGDALRAVEEDPGTAYAVPVEGSIIWVDAMVVPKRAPNAEAAHRFIEFLLRPDVGAQLSNFNRYATPNKAAMASILPEDRNNPQIYPPPEVMSRLEFLEDLGEDTRIYDEVWTAVKAR